MQETLESLPIPVSVAWEVERGKERHLLAF